jgi:uncharacterized membrane protein YgdD (TMEM256/DUF423 family)
MNSSLTTFLNPMYKPALLSGSIFGLLAVITGAFGAHYLKTILSADLLQSFETGVRYQFYHAVLLLFVSVYGQYISNRYRKLITLFFILGILLFSGSIYLLCFLKSAQIIGLSGIGILTPLGGLCFITGWILILLSAGQAKQLN